MSDEFGKEAMDEEVVAIKKEIKELQKLAAQRAGKGREMAATGHFKQAKAYGATVKAAHAKIKKLREKLAKAIVAKGKEDVEAIDGLGYEFSPPSGGLKWGLLGLLLGALLGKNLR